MAPLGPTAPHRPHTLSALETNAPHSVHRYRTADDGALSTSSTDRPPRSAGERTPDRASSLAFAESIPRARISPRSAGSDTVAPQFGQDSASLGSSSPQSGQGTPGRSGMPANDFSGRT